MDPQEATILVWFVWMASWLIAALWARQTAKGAGFSAQLPYRLVTVVGALLLFGIYTHSYRGPDRLWVLSDSVEWALVALVAAGFLFAWWARLHLGALWSGFVMKKEGHYIVDTGPYALVRHPIYTGLILSSLATAIQRGEALALLGFALMTLGFWMKARLEENFLRQELGAETYDSYRRRVPMLVPFGPKSA
jgi:protein-S-isoprenylcysteine O-methyltransferase Ste14